MARISDISKIISILLKKYKLEIPWNKSNYSLFEILISVILSQRTYWRNAQLALKRFRSKFRSLRELSLASEEEIAEIIRPAGLYKIKARRIKMIASALLKEYEGALDWVLRLSCEKAREELMKLAGIGPKTADVFLMIARGEKIIPIDTHIFRIMRRLGIASAEDNYESLKKKLEEHVSPELRPKLHFILIKFGRNICKARNPKCSDCPIAMYCDWFKNQQRK